MFALSKNPTIDEIQDLYRSHTANVTDVAKFFLNRIESLDKDIQSVVRGLGSFVFDQASKLDIELEGHQDIESLLKEKPLFGIPYALKDNVLVQNLHAYSQSKVLEGYIAPYSADIYTNLDEAGALLLVQVNMDEFAVGASTEYSGFDKKTKNPADLSRVPGGSSGGSAAIVASGQVPFAIGSDTGGSIRLPASYCGVYGYRPTFGMVSRYGIMALASSLDQAGPLCNTPKDIKTVFNVLSSGSTSHEQTCLSFINDKDDIKKIEPKEKYVIGKPKEFFADGIDPKIIEKIELVLKQLEEGGHTIKEIELPYTKYSIAAYYILQPVEAAANFERYDGVRYGHQPDDIKESMFYAARDLFGPEVKRRIMMGTYTSSAGYYDAYYNQACRMREKITQDFKRAFDSVDIIIGPTAPTVAFKIGQNTEDPLAMYLADVIVSPQSIAKLPAISIPVGTLPVDGKDLPVGLQVTAPELGENVIFDIAETISKLKF